MFWKSRFSQTFFNKSWSPTSIFFKEKLVWKDLTNFQQWKMTLKIRILRCLRRLFIILVSLLLMSFSAKMLISTRYMNTYGFMPDLFKKYWTVSKLQLCRSRQKTRLEKNRDVTHPHPQWEDMSLKWAMIFALYKLGLTYTFGISSCFFKFHKYDAQLQVCLAGRTERWSVWYFMDVTLIRILP